MCVLTGSMSAQSEKEHMQDVHSRQGRVHAAGSRGALRLTHTSFCPGQCLYPPSWIFRSKHRQTEIEISWAHGLVQDLINIPFTPLGFLQSLRDRLSLSVLEDGSRKAERLENFLVKSNSTVQKFLYWDFLANILPSGSCFRCQQ